MPCDHKFVDSNVCLKCGVSFASLRAEHARELAALGGIARSAAAPRPLRAFRRVAYGFVATEPGSVLRDQTFHMSPARPFRPWSIAMWEPGEEWGYRRFEQAIVESLQIGSGEESEQLMGPVPATIFLPADVSAKDFLAHWLVEARSAPLVTLIGEPLRASLGLAVGMMPTASIGCRISLRFKGALRGMLLLGEELLDPAPDSAPGADQRKHEG